MSLGLRLAYSALLSARDGVVSLLPRWAPMESRKTASLARQPVGGSGSTDWVTKRKTNTSNVYEGITRETRQERAEADVLRTIVAEERERIAG